MKRYVSAVLLISFAFASQRTNAQNEDKSKRPSPLVTVSQKLSDGVTVSIHYGQPSLKGRTIGKSVEPMDGNVWRTGANEATVFEVDKAVTIDGAKLPAGKYGLFTLFQGSDVTFIFNKTWNQWGAFDYKEADDQLRVKTKFTAGNASADKMTFKIDKQGAVTLLWGDRKASFKVK